MATLTERIPDVITYLLEQAAVNPRLGAADPPVTIIDGQPATEDPLVVDGSGLALRLWVGSTGWVTSGQMDEAATADQGFAFLDQARTRDDQLEIAMAAEAVSGDAVMATARNGAFSVMAAVEVMLRGSPPVGPGDASMGGLVYWSEVTGPVEAMQGQISQGACVLVRFRVSGFTRLTS